MSSSKQLAVDSNILMDSTKPDSATDVEPVELKAAREVGAQLLTDYSLVYNKKIEQEWIAKGITSNPLLLQLLRMERLKFVVSGSLNGGQAQQMAKYVDSDDQPFVLAAAAIDDGARVLVTRDPKTTLKESRRWIKKEFGVEVKTASEFVT
jgi:hypothetical protein